MGAVTVMDVAHVPHILNHPECHLSNVAKIWSNFSHCRAGELKSPSFFHTYLPFAHAFFRS